MADVLALLRDCDPAAHAPAVADPGAVRARATHEPRAARRHRRMPSKRARARRRHRGARRRRHRRGRSPAHRVRGLLVPGRRRPGQPRAIPCTRSPAASASCRPSTSRASAASSCGPRPARARRACASACASPTARGAPTPTVEATVPACFTERDDPMFRDDAHPDRHRLARDRHRRTDFNRIVYGVIDSDVPPTAVRIVDRVTGASTVVVDGRWFVYVDPRADPQRDDRQLVAYDSAGHIVTGRAPSGRSERDAARPQRLAARGGRCDSSALRRQGPRRRSSTSATSAALVVKLFTQMRSTTPDPCRVPAGRSGLRPRDEDGPAVAPGYAPTISRACRTSETPWRPLTFTDTRRCSPRAPPGIFHVHVATWPAMSPLPFSNRAREARPAVHRQGVRRHGHAPERHAHGIDLAGVRLGRVHARSSAIPSSRSLRLQASPRRCRSAPRRAARGGELFPAGGCRRRWGRGGDDRGRRRRRRGRRRRGWRRSGRSGGGGGGGGGGAPALTPPAKSCTQKPPATPTPIDRNVGFSMFALCPGDAIQSAMTWSAVCWPAAMFSPSAPPAEYPQSVMRVNGSRATGGAGSLWSK